MTRASRAPWVERPVRIDLIRDQIEIAEIADRGRSTPRSGLRPGVTGWGFLPDCRTATVELPRVATTPSSRPRSPPCTRLRASYFRCTRRAQRLLPTRRPRSRTSGTHSTRDAIAAADGGVHDAPAVPAAILADQAEEQPVAHACELGNRSRGDNAGVYARRPGSTTNSETDQRASGDRCNNGMKQFPERQQEANARRRAGRSPSEEQRQPEGVQEEVVCGFDTERVSPRTLREERIHDAPQDRQTERDEQRRLTRGTSPREEPATRLRPRGAAAAGDRSARRQNRATMKPRNQLIGLCEKSGSIDDAGQVRNVPKIDRRNAGDEHYVQTFGIAFSWIMRSGGTQSRRATA